MEPLLTILGVLAGLGAAAWLLHALTLPILRLHGPAVDKTQHDSYGLKLADERIGSIRYEAWYLRMTVTNCGARTARNCVAYLQSAKLDGDDKDLQPRTDKLAWCGDWGERFDARMLPGFRRGRQMIDILKVNAKDRLLEAQTPATSSRLSTWGGAGTYTIRVYVECDGVSLGDAKTIRVRFDPNPGGFPTFDLA